MLRVILAALMFVPLASAGPSGCVGTNVCGTIEGAQSGGPGCGADTYHGRFITRAEVQFHHDRDASDVTRFRTDDNATVEHIESCDNTSNGERHASHSFRAGASVDTPAINRSVHMNASLAWSSHPPGPASCWTNVTGDVGPHALPCVAFPIPILTGNPPCPLLIVGPLALPPACIAHPWV